MSKVSKILSFALVLFIVLGLTPSFGQESTVTYKVNSDGSVTRMQGTSNLKNVGMLQTKKVVLEEQVGLFDGLKTMTPEQLQAAHALWEKYREPVSKGVITIPQAITNITASTREEITAMDEAIKKSK